MRSAEVNRLSSIKARRKFRAVYRGTFALLILLSCNSFAQAAFQFDSSSNLFFLLYSRMVSNDGNRSQINSRITNQFSSNDGGAYDLHTFCAGVQLVNVNYNAVTIGCRDRHGNIDLSNPAVDVDLPKSEGDSTDTDDEPAIDVPAGVNLPADSTSIVDGPADAPNSDPASDSTSDSSHSDSAATDPPAEDPPISLSAFSPESDLPTVNSDDYTGPDDDWDPVAAAPEVSSLAVWSVLGLCGIAAGISRRRKVGRPS